MSGDWRQRALQGWLWAWSLSLPAQANDMSPVMLSLATLLGLVALLPSSLVGWLLPRLDDPPVASPGWVFVRAVLAGVTVGVGCGLALGKSLSAMVTWTFGGALAASAVVVLAARRQA